MTQRTSLSVLAAFLTLSSLVHSSPVPQSTRFLPQVSRPNSLGTQAAAIGTALPLGFIAFNVLRGDTDLSVSPNIGLNVDPNTGALRPSVTANVQVGNSSPINPTINLGAQFDPNSKGPLPLAPVVGTGVNIGDASSGNPTANLGSNFAFSNGQANGQFGGNFGLGAFNLGRPLGGQSNRPTGFQSNFFNGLLG